MNLSGMCNNYAKMTFMLRVLQGAWYLVRCGVLLTGRKRLRPLLRGLNLTEVHCFGAKTGWRTRLVRLPAGLLAWLDDNWRSSTFGTMASVGPAPLRYGC
jgi:hypothetical protein